MSRRSIIAVGAAVVALAAAAIPAGAQSGSPVGQNGWTVQLFAASVQPVDQAGPASLAFDANDNLYLAPNGYEPNGAGSLSILKIAAGTTTPVTFGPPIEDADGVAVDILGNVNVGGDPVTQLNSAGVPVWMRSCPDGNPNRAAVDAAGNVYVGTIPLFPSGLGGTHVCKFPSDGTSVTKLGTNTLNWPSNVGVGPDGYLYVAEVPPATAGTPRLLRLNRNTGLIVGVVDTGTAYGQPAFDDHDNIYLPAALHGEVYQLNLVSGQKTLLASGLDFPNAAAFDSHGTLYVTDSGTKSVYRLIRPTITVMIDVRPGCLRSNGNGVIPVAIFSTPTFDATQIDAASLALDGQPVNSRPNGTLQVITPDLDGDGLDDLLVLFDNVAGTYPAGLGTGTVTGVTTDWDPIEGHDSICVV